VPFSELNWWGIAGDPERQEKLASENPVEMGVEMTPKSDKKPQTRTKPSLR
jgi:glucose dehydrogenase